MIPRLYRSGRRSDRWLGWVLMLLHCFMAVFIVYTSYQQGEAEKAREETVIARDRAEIQRAELARLVADQNRLMLCFATDTQTFNLAVANAILATPPQPQQAAEYEGLRVARDRLASSERFSQANPPNCVY